MDESDGDFDEKNIIAVISNTVTIPSTIINIIMHLLFFTLCTTPYREKVKTFIS